MLHCCMRPNYSKSTTQPQPFIPLTTTQALLRCNSRRHNAAKAQVVPVASSHANKQRSPSMIVRPSIHATHPKQLLAMTLAASLGAALLLASPAIADTNPQALFQQSCVGCHAGGGNVVQPGATLRLQDLERNGIADPEAIYKLVYFGRGKMPGYGIDCAPKGQCTFAKRLSDEDIQGLTNYVLEQAKNEWK